MRRKFGAGFLFEPKRKTILLRAVNEIRTQRFVVPNGFSVRNPLLGRSRALLHACQIGTSPCAKHVESLWDVDVDRIFRGTVCLRFRGQSDSHSCEFAWTEFAPLRRSAIRSLTTRLNVPVVRERLGQKSERSHKLDHRGLLHFLFSSENGQGRS